MLVGYTVKLVTITILYIYMYLVNKKRDREAASRVSEDPSAAGQEEREAIENGMLVCCLQFLWFFKLLPTTTYIGVRYKLTDSIGSNRDR